MSQAFALSIPRIIHTKREFSGQDQCYQLWCLQRERSHLQVFSTSVLREQLFNSDFFNISIKYNSPPSQYQKRFQR
ncbi:unnamed protein product [Onchocerca flexuosa]|uniref:Ovule protein n=1 Tax=Onchocerca flexuosa TaxID=387005 RepID=A0A183HR28_9BILA|nr:unnamed protein product [Onchocerca flexuosa]